MKSRIDAEIAALRNRKIDDKTAKISQNRELKREGKSKKNEALAQKAYLLELEVEHLENRNRALAETPNLEEATTLVFAADTIKRIDLLDSIIKHIDDTESGNLVEQLRLLRKSMLDMLRMHNISEYKINPGTKVDVATRHKIEITNDLRESGQAAEPKSGKVLETLKTGFISAPADSKTRILRKAEVVLKKS